MSQTETRDQVRTVKSADRTLEILEFLAGVKERITLGELSRELGYPKSSLHGLMRTMETRGWVQADSSGLRFGLGVRALLVGASYIESDDVVGLAADTLDWLADAVGETVHLGRIDGPDIVYLAKRESKHPLRLFSAIGRRLPAHATALGKAILAQHDEEDLVDALPAQLRALTPNTIVDHALLREELARTRDRGFAVDNEENSLEIRCFAVPLRTTRPVQDAVSCSVPTMRLTEDLEAQIVEHLQTARTRIEDRARGRAPR